MAYPYSNLYGDISLSVTLAGAAASVKAIDVAAGLPVVDQLADLLIRHGINKADTLNANGQYAYKLQKGGSDLTYGETFAQQGVHDGDTLDIVTV